MVYSLKDKSTLRLQDAAKRGDINKVMRLIKSGVSVNSVDKVRQIWKGAS